MIKIRVVTKATVEVVKPGRLLVGDDILWANRKGRILRIYRSMGEGLRQVVVQFGNESEMMLPSFTNYYRILSCEEIEEEV